MKLARNKRTHCSTQVNSRVHQTIHFHDNKYFIYKRTRATRENSMDDWSPRVFTYKTHARKKYTLGLRQRDKRTRQRDIRTCKVRVRHEKMTRFGPQQSQSLCVFLGFRGVSLCCIDDWG